MSSTLKVTFIGDGAVGKTCIAIRMMENVFPEDFIPSVSDFDSRLTLEHAGTTVQLQYTTRCREKTAIVSAQWASLELLCAALCSLWSIQFLSRTFRPSGCPNGSITCPTFLPFCLRRRATYAIVLSKLAAVNQVPIGTEARKFAFDHGLVYVETSARTGSGIEELKAKLLELGLEHESKRRASALSPARKPKCILL
jgi:hypothetical protein